MVNQIILGNFNTINGRNVLTGGQSGLDTKGIVDGLVKIKRLPAVKLETANKTIDTKTKALGDLKAIFTKLRTAVDNLRNPPGVDTASKNIFEYRTSSLTAVGGVVASDYVGITVQPGAAVASYTINSITQLAQATKQQTGTFTLADTTTASAVTAGATAGLFKAGTVNIRAVDGTAGGIPITLTAGDSLQTVANKFNEVSSRTGIQATILNVSSGNYKLIFTATKTGTTYGFDLGATSPTPGFGVQSDASGVLSQVSFGNITPAQNAIFSVDGSSITRESNAVSDVISGVTIALKEAAPAGNIYINVKADTDLVSKSISQFADAYNEFRLFASKQSELDDSGKPKETAVLYNDSTFRSFVDAMSSEVTQIIGGISGSSNPTQLSDIGLKLDNFAGDDTNLATKNIISVDSDALNSALQTNFDGVRKLFEYQQTADNVNFLASKRSNNIAGITSYSVSINQTTNTYTITANSNTYSLDYTALPGGGVSLKGQTGTPFDGMEFVFASTADTTVNVTLAQGYGDRFYNLMDGYLNTSNGLLTTQVNDLATTKQRNTDEVTKIDDQMTDYRDKLTTRYAALESALSKANQILALLDAQSSARQSNG